MKRNIWIVEVAWLESLWDKTRRPGPESAAWATTVGGGLTRKDGRAVLHDWKRRNPDDYFRLRRYRPDA